MIGKARPLVTIGIPTYNRADGYLREAIKSASAQTYADIEIVVSDNCSVDDTESVVKQFADERIRYFKHESNIGANNNFNFCLEQARGDYFLLLHDDDLIDPDFVETCMDRAGGDTGIGIIRTGTRAIDADGRVLSEMPNEVSGFPTADFFLGWYKGRTALYLCSTLYNTKHLKGIGGFQSRTNLFQDAVAVVRLAAEFGRLDIYDIKASFRKHGVNMGFTANVDGWIEDSLYLLDVMCDLVPAKRREQVRLEGMVNFSKKNYRHAALIKSPVNRFLSYADVFKRFEYSYSPVRFIYERSVLSRVRALKNRYRDMLS